MGIKERTMRRFLDIDTELSSLVSRKVCCRRTTQHTTSSQAFKPWYVNRLVAGVGQPREPPSNGNHISINAPVFLARCEEQGRARHCSASVLWSAPLGACRQTVMTVIPVVSATQKVSERLRARRASILPTVRIVGQKHAVALGRRAARAGHRLEDCSKARLHPWPTNPVLRWMPPAVPGSVPSLEELSVGRV